jgi:hypothetical protein
VIAARFAREAGVDVGVGGNAVVGFNDIAGHWAAADINYIAANGWIFGYLDGSFKPEQLITRAEFITIVNRILERAPESIDDLPTEDIVIFNDCADSGAWYYLMIIEATNSHQCIRKTGVTVPGTQYEYERWTSVTENPNWIELEQSWVVAYSTP